MDYKVYKVNVVPMVIMVLMELLGLKVLWGPRDLRVRMELRY